MPASYFSLHATASILVCVLNGLGVEIGES